MLTKKVQRSEELYVQFTKEELKSLNIKPGDKFSWEIEDESLVLKKFASIDIDISELSREVLEMLIVDSVEKDISVNDVISNILKQCISKENV